MTTQFPDVAHVSGAAVLPSFPEAGLERRVGAYNEKLFLAEHRMAKGRAAFPEPRRHIIVHPRTPHHQALSALPLQITPNPR